MRLRCRSLHSDSLRVGRDRFQTHVHVRFFRARQDRPQIITTFQCNGHGFFFPGCKEAGARRPPIPSSRKNRFIPLLLLYAFAWHRENFTTTFIPTAKKYITSLFITLLGIPSRFARHVIGVLTNIICIVSRCLQCFLNFQHPTYSVWIRKTNQMSLFVFFISLLIVAQHVSGNHVPIIRS